MANQGPELLCLKGGSAEVVEKKSRFIAQVSPVKNEEEALQFIARIRKENRDARHNCFAYVTGPDGSIEKFSDDGEPSKTAGMPMLDLLRKRGLKNACVVVTRYFGGILLGAGGLVRAYGASARQAVEAAGLAVFEPWSVLRVSLSYSDYQKLQAAIPRLGAVEDSCDFGSDVTSVCAMLSSREEDFRRAVAELTAGRASVTLDRVEERASPA